MPVQLFQEQEDQPEAATFKTLTLKKNSCRGVSAIADKGRSRTTEWYEANIG
jgi:hypothetical protein